MRDVDMCYYGNSMAAGYGSAGMPPVSNGHGNLVKDYSFMG